MARKTFRKKITSDELTKKINTKNIKLAERCLKEKNTRCADTTIDNYRSDLNIFFTWNLLYNENKFFVDVKKLELADFFSFGVSEMQWGSSRFARMRSALSTLSEFIEKFYDDDYPTFRNMVLKAIDLMPKVAARDKTILSEEQVNDLFNHLKNEEKRPQDACLLALAIGSGARISELVRFTTDIIDEDYTAFEDMFLETTKQIKTKGFTKQGKMLTKYIIKDIFLPYYKEWLEERKKIMEKHNKEHNHIFITQTGDPATDKTLRYWVKRWEDYLECDVYMHCFRHYIVTHLTRLGLPSDFIVEIMGWGTAEMYKVYNDLSAKERKWKNLDKLKDHLDNSK